MKMNINQLAACLGLYCLIGLIGLSGSHAAEPASASLRILVGFAAGGSADIVARAMAPRLAEGLKQAVLIDNKPGAGGNIATDALIKSPSDGNTIMLGTVGSLAVNQHLTKLSYNPVSDTEILTLAVVFSNVLVVPVASPVRNLEDYVRLGKLPSSRLSFGSSGIGSSGHLAGELLKAQAGLNNEHVAYRGGAPAMNDLLGGVLPSIFASPGDAVQHVQSGKLRAIATTGKKRLEVLAHIPTVAESGFAGFEATNWYAFAAPPKTPPELLKRLNTALVATLSDPGVAAQLRKLGMEPSPTSAEEAQRYVRAESEKWSQVIRKAKITVDGS